MDLLVPKIEPAYTKTSIHLEQIVHSIMFGLIAADRSLPSLTLWKHPLSFASATISCQIILLLHSVSSACGRTQQKNTEQNNDVVSYLRSQDLRIAQIDLCD